MCLRSSDGDDLASSQTVAAGGASAAGAAKTGSTESLAQMVLRMRLNSVAKCSMRRVFSSIDGSPFCHLGLTQTKMNMKQLPSSDGCSSRVSKLSR
jgi:hypothetical protein